MDDSRRGENVKAECLADTNAADEDIRPSGAEEARAQCPAVLTSCQKAHFPDLRQPLEASRRDFSPGEGQQYPSLIGIGFSIGSFIVFRG